MAKGRRRNDDLEIVYEDQWLIIVNKPSGLLSMSTRKQGEDTAYARVFDYAGKIFIVHRLDRDTSGLLVFAKDEEVIKLTALILNLTLLISIFSILLAYFVLEFIVPLFFKNGQTLGKKMFGIGVMRDDGVKMTTVMLFVRSILGKCTIEALVPLAIIMLIFFGNAGIFGLVAILLLAGLEIFTTVRTRTNSCIHDLLSYSVVVDLASQMIFENEEALVEYKNRVHAELVDRSDY